MEQSIEMNCACGANLILNVSAAVDNVWMLAQRFANAHVVCGYMTNSEAPEGENEQTTVILPKGKSRKVIDEDEE